MKINPTLFALVLLSITTTTFAQGAEKTLVKTFQLNGISQINFGINADIEVNHWKEPHLRIQMKVKLANGNEYLLKSLVSKGRYNLRGTVENGIFSIYAPGLAQKVKFKAGHELREEISIEVFIPETVSVQIEELACESLYEILDVH